MAAASKDRSTQQVDHPLNDLKSHTAKTAARFYKGAIVQKLVNELGVCSPGSTLTGSIGAGVSQENKTAAAGDTILVAEGVHFFNNSSSSDECLEADVGKLCYIVDDTTVAKTSNSGARSIAGRIYDVVSGTVDQPGRGVAVLFCPALIPSGSTL